MTLTSNYTTAWGLTLAPIVLFIPAFLLAGMGPCSFEHPIVMVMAFLLFVGLEVAALPRFVGAARSRGKVPVAIVGIAMALLLLVLNAVLGFYILSDYWA